jgi:hypothetical protein
MPYRSASVEAQGDSPLVIECPRGIPFRLKVVDEQGRPVEARVTYDAVRPNPFAPNPSVLPNRRPLSQADRLADGTYQGYAVPGPGAVLVRVTGKDYRPAYVDPKAFFAPGPADWKSPQRAWKYGTQDTLETTQGTLGQNDYAAIVLINPAQDSAPLELSATVAKDAPRRVSLVDPQGKPVVGAVSHGMTRHRNESTPPLRAASFALANLHPRRARRITFYDLDRKLVGFLLARGDGDTPYTVRMEPWGAVTGRFVDEHDKPTKAGISLRDSNAAPNDDPGVGEHARIHVENDGRFRMEGMVPGQRYSAKIYRSYRFRGMAFDYLEVRPGEVRHLGAIRLQPPLDVHARREPSHQQIPGPPRGQTLVARTSPW